MKKKTKEQLEFILSKTKDFETLKSSEIDSAYDWFVDFFKNVEKNKVDKKYKVVCQEEDCNHGCFHADYEGRCGFVFKTDSLVEAITKRNEHQEKCRFRFNRSSFSVKKRWFTLLMKKNRGKYEGIVWPEILETSK